MLERADQVIDRVMEKVIALGGVVSGEHGIGLTKLKYLEPERIAELAVYRHQVDPDGLMNPGKLEDIEALRHIFTPSLCAGHAQQFGGESPPPNLMEVKG
jgi:D-lactate dehydrogenase (cytochrome)